MEKLFLVTAFLFLSYTEISAQCTSCSGTTNTGNTSSAIGINTVSKGLTSFASGFGSQATEGYTTALGFYSFATYNKATAIGSTVKSSGYQSIVLGSGDYNTGTYLINNIPRSLMIGFHSLYPTLFVVGDDTPNVFNKTGRVGIGNITAPQAKLHILADAGEDAAILIQPAATDWNLGQPAAVLLGNAENGLFATKTNGLSFQSPMNFTFGNNLLFINKNGNVGIGTVGNLPETKLDVNGTVKMTGLRLFDQTVHTGYVLTCSGINGQAIWQNPDAFSTWTVNGKIWSHEVEVKLTDWWDEVLTKDYKLMPLHQLESYIATNKHLPDIPTEKEVLKNGVELGEMNALLLKKVEE